MALEWIQNHIIHFGGDPNQVTIGGLSAGAMSVSALFMSTVTRNLFNNIITMSGSSLIPTSFLNREKVVPLTRHLAKVVNCPADDNLMMKCLMDVDGERLVLDESFGDGLMIFGPVSGDELIPKSTKELINQNLKVARSDFRVLTGFVNWEGGIMKFSMNKDNTSRSAIVNKVLNTFKDNSTEIDYKKGITNVLVDDFKIPVNEAENIANYYLKNANNRTDDSDRNRFSLIALFDLIGDINLSSIF